MASSSLLERLERKRQNLHRAPIPPARHELSALGLIAALLMIYPLLGAPTGFCATLVVTALIGRRVGRMVARRAHAITGSGQCPIERRREPRANYPVVLANRCNPRG
jgi:hypothetical protein